MVAQAVDCADWLPNDLLIRLDRYLMARGTEGRTPFLDIKMAELALRLPDELKIHSPGRPSTNVAGRMARCVRL